RLRQKRTLPPWRSKPAFDQRGPGSASLCGLNCRAELRREQNWLTRILARWLRGQAAPHRGLPDRSAAAKLAAKRSIPGTPVQFLFAHEAYDLAGPERSSRRRSA